MNNGSQTYSGEYFILMADITVTETVSDTPAKMVGSSDSKSFQGTFDGNGYTITLNYSDTRNADFCAPFRYIKGATIKYLHVAGTIYKTKGKNADGLVGKAMGDNTTSKCGGFVGWAAGNDWAGVKFIDCIFAPSEVSILTDGSATFSRKPNNSDFITVTVENSYYTQRLGTKQGEMAYTSQPIDVTTEAMTVAGVTVYVKKTLVTNVAATDITPTTANISWTGYADSYNLRYSQGGAVKVTLSVPNDFWQDGTGYQMLLDADHNTYGTVIPASGGLTDASLETYANFEYKIPTNADGNLNTTNVVNGTTVTEVTIIIVAGIYDWCITNPSPGDGRVWIASEHGNVGGRQDDFVFEAGKHYTFTVTFDDGSGNDCVNMTVEDDATLSPGGVTDVTGITSTSYTMSSLTASTDYSVYVQSVKGDKTSEWSGIYFTTLGEGFYRFVEGYGDSNGGYVLLASPVGPIDPENVTNMLTNTYDLYRFNQSVQKVSKWNGKTGRLKRQTTTISTLNLAKATSTPTARMSC